MLWTPENSASPHGLCCKQHITIPETIPHLFTPLNIYIEYGAITCFFACPTYTHFVGVIAPQFSFGEIPFLPQQPSQLDGHAPGRPMRLVISGIRIQWQKKGKELKRVHSENQKNRKSQKIIVLTTTIPLITPSSLIHCHHSKSNVWVFLPFCKLTHLVNLPLSKLYGSMVTNKTPKSSNQVNFPT